eukprot:311306_1
MKLNLIQFNKEDIQDTIDKLFKCDTILQISQSLQNMSDEEKQEMFNATYISEGCFSTEMTLLDYINYNLSYSFMDNETLRSKFKHIFSVLVDHGMNLMPSRSSENTNSHYGCYFDSDFTFPLKFKVQLIKKFEQHPFHYDYFTKHGSPALITLCMSGCS